MAVLGAPAVRRLGGRTRTIMTVPEKQKRLERRRDYHGRWIRTLLCARSPPPLSLSPHSDRARSASCTLRGLFRYEAPSGCGEPPVSMISPAVVKALYHLTGKRYRSLLLVEL